VPWRNAQPAFPGKCAFEGGWQPALSGECGPPAGCAPLATPGGGSVGEQRLRLGGVGLLLGDVALRHAARKHLRPAPGGDVGVVARVIGCLLYTSDAADE